MLTTIGLIYKLAALSASRAGPKPASVYVIVGLLVGGTAGSIMAKRSR